MSLPLLRKASPTSPGFESRSRAAIRSLCGITRFPCWTCMARMTSRSPCLRHGGARACCGWPLPVQSKSWLRVPMPSGAAKSRLRRRPSPIFCGNSFKCHHVAQAEMNHPQAACRRANRGRCQLDIGQGLNRPARVLLTAAATTCRSGPPRRARTHSARGRVRCRPPRRWH